jgi:predicted P-loop ATPase
LPNAWRRGGQWSAEGEAQREISPWRLHYKGFEAEHIKPQQEARYEADVWEEKIVPFLEGRDRVTVYEIAKDALLMETSQIGTHDQRRIGGILTALKWIPFKSNGKRGYKRSE